ncbi:MAG: transposase [Acidobacteriaceae bacterium]|nr:transposase [Acidobacteriaceae bacterium]
MARNPQGRGDISGSAAEGVNESTTVTVLTDGEAGLRSMQRQVAPRAEHILDWFHIALRFENLKQVAKGINGLTEGAVRRHALEQLDRVKWRFWHGQVNEG